MPRVAVAATRKDRPSGGAKKKATVGVEDDLDPAHEGSALDEQEGGLGPGAGMNAMKRIAAANALSGGGRGAAGAASAKEDGSSSTRDDPAASPKKPCGPLAPICAPDPKGIFAFKPHVKAFYDNQWIQWGVAGLIVANFITNIFEKQFDPAGNKFPDVFFPIYEFFKYVFTVELLVNMYGNFFRDFICSGWNIFDCIVVLEGFLPLPPEFRLLRCLRTLRVFRLFKRIKSLLKILNSIMSAIPGVVNAFAVVVIVISIYSILAVEFFYKFDQHIVVVGNETQVECYYYNYGRDAVDGELERVYSVTPRGLCFSEEYYGTFFRAWYSLFQILTGDSWSEVLARPVIFGWDDFVSPMTDPETGEVTMDNSVSNTISTIYFMTFVLINSFVLINVVVAVLLDKMVSANDEGVEEEEEDESLAGLSTGGALTQKQMDEQRALAGKVDAMTVALNSISKALDVNPGIS